MSESTTSAVPQLEPAPAAAPEPGKVACARDADGVVWLRLGAPGEDLVTLTEERIASLEAALTELEGDRSVRGVIVTGPHERMFAAGADVHAIAAIPDAAAGEAAARRGQAAFARLEALPVPVVAAIGGPCLGGGLELALACDVRVASDAPVTKLGLPEVKLGIVPGFGGTQRLPRLVGLPKAVELILRGTLLRPEQALRAGVVDRVAPAERLLQVARRVLDERMRTPGKPPARRRWPAMTRFLSHTPVGRVLLRRKTERSLDDGPARFYPAPRRALALCVDAFARDPHEGFAREAAALGELIATPVSRALVRLFFASEAQKKLGRAEGAAEVRQALVLGAGVMGSGIAALLVQQGIRVRLCDVDGGALASARARLAADLERKVARRSLAPHEAQACLDRLALGLREWGRLDHYDLVLEAVVEDLAVKQALFAEAVQRGLRPDAVVASNTSSLSIDAMAELLPSPERLVGIHFFNPPQRMPLIEVVRGRQTSAAAVASACRLATRLGKTPVVVADRPGFLVNRCLAPYLDQAARLLLAGLSPEAIDRVMLEFGMPMGPCRLLDEIGYDVAHKVGESMAHAFGDRMRPAPLASAMVEAGVVGRKRGGGLYGPDGRGPGPGRAVLARLRAGKAPAIAASEVRARLLFPMVDEAFRCLAERVVANTDELDVAFAFGIGFPAFTGSLTGFAAAEGLGRIVETLDELARRAHPGLAASDALRQRACTRA